MQRAAASLVVLAALAGLAAADKDWWDAGLTVVQRSLLECEAAKDVAACLKVKAIRTMDRALHTDAVPLVGGVSLVRREEARSARALPALPALPRDAGRRADQLDGLLLGRAARLVETRSLQLALPKLAAGVQEAFEGSYSADDQQAVEEGRGRGGKLKKMAGPAILIMVMAAYKLAMMMAGVAMLSGKALIVSKVALTLAGVAVLKKLLSHNDHEKTTVEIVKTPQVSHSHSYSHEHDDHGYGDKSWTSSGGYSHRSIADDSADGSQGGSPYLMPQDVASKRDFRTAPAPVNYVTGRGVESLSIRSHDPLRIVVSESGEHDDVRVHHRQRGLDLPVLPGPSAPVPPVDEPIDTQFGEADRGAWRGLGSALMPASERSLRAAPSSEQQERSLDGSVNEESSNYQPRSLGSYPAVAA